MTSDAQHAANRRNAQKSTGPATPEGKQRSRMNALKHGTFLKHNDHGEATLRHVLLWDKIGTLEVEQNSAIKNLIPQLLQRSEERRKHSKDFTEFKEDIAFFTKKENSAAMASSAETPPSLWSSPSFSMAIFTPRFTSS